MVQSKFRTLDLAYTAIGAALIAICSWISIPLTVPFTMQTFAVFFVLLLLGGMRDSLSILAVLGEIDPACGFFSVELADISKLDELRKQHPILDTMNIITCSDAHYLENMRDAANTLELPELTREAVIEYLDTQR